MSKTLNEIRKQIDSIDDQVHDLLMERAALVSSVVAAKKKDGMQIVQPSREARLMRRLLARHNSDLPKDTIVRIWRELIGSVQLMQTGYRAVVAADEHADLYWEMAKNYFGSAVPMNKVQGYQSAIASVRDDDASFAVLPWPALDDVSPWWANLLNRQEGEALSIVCALPYCNARFEKNYDNSRAVVISKIAFLPSDNDVSFFALELSRDTSRARAKEVAERIGLNVLGVYTATLSHNEDVRMHLLEVEGYHESGSDVCKNLMNEIGDVCYYCDVIGGYPVVPDVNDDKNSDA